MQVIPNVQNIIVDAPLKMQINNKKNLLKKNLSSHVRESVKLMIKWLTLSIFISLSFWDKM